MGAILVLGIIIAIAALVFFIVFAVLEKRKKLAKLFELRLLLIELPQKQPENEKPAEPLKEINRSSQLLAALVNIKMPFALEIAVHNVGEDILFYVAIPESAIQYVTSQIHGLWPEAQIKISEEYTIFHPQGSARGAYLKQKHSMVLPIRTYEEAQIDTFASIVSNFAKLELVGEGMAMQILVKPASDTTRESMTKAIYRLKKGAKLADIIKEPFLQAPEGLAKMGKIIDAVSGPATKQELPKEPTIVDEEAVKALTQKLAKPNFEVNVRLVAGAVSDFQAENLLEGLANSFQQFTAPIRNDFRIVKPRNLKNFTFKYIMREFDPAQSMILNADEIASIFHLPTATTSVPKIKWLKAKESTPPTTLATSGVLVGESFFRSEKRPVYINEEDRRRHVYVIGQTGTGKSTLLTNMVIDDITKGKGVAIVDPHGDLVETILGLVPRERAEDVIVFEPGYREHPLGMNMLEYDVNKPEEKTFIVNELFNILDKLYDMKTVGGPMFEQYTKNAILLLMEDAQNEPATLMEIPRVFTDAAYRARKLQRISNPIVIDFWEKEATKATGEHSLQNMAPYITSKFNNFIANDYVRPIVGQFKSAFNFREVMDQGKILLVNLSKGKIGDINANLLGMVITGKILMAALSRVDMAESARRDFNLYIDEFQNFTTDSIAIILSEARKYKLSLTIAHQFIGQLTEKIRDAVFGNVGSIISFRIGADDAEFLIKQFEPVFGKNDLINIDNFNAYVKILINGQTSQPFNIKTLKPAKPSLESGQDLKQLSALKYGRDRKEVELEILDRLRK